MALEVFTRGSQGKAWKSLQLLLDGGVVYPLSLANGGTGQALADPGADRILFWDDSAGAVAFLTVGGGLGITTTTLSAPADPDVLESGSLTGSSIDMFEDSAGLWAQYRYLTLQIAAASHNNASATISILVSDDGSTFPTANYDGMRITDGGSGNQTTAFLALIATTNAASTGAFQGTITNHHGGGNCSCDWYSTSSTGALRLGKTSYIGSTNPIKGFRIIPSAGTLDAGTYTLIGIK